MANGSDSIFLDGRLGDNVMRALVGPPAIYADGSVGTPPPLPAYKNGNPYYDENGDRIPGSPGSN